MDAGARSNAVKNWIAERGVKRAVVVGGGFIGLEVVENLVHRGISTTVVEMLNQVSEGGSEGGRCADGQPRKQSRSGCSRPV